MQRSTMFSKGRKGLAAFFVAMTIASLLPTMASADIVSGRIFGLDEKPIVNGTFTAKDAKGASTTIKTNAMGNFSVYLDPGKYTITSTTDPSLTGSIESFPQAKQQDVHLKKGN